MLAKKAIESGVFPLGYRTLLTLIKNGELAKKGKYNGLHYIRAINLCEGNRVIWDIPEEEILAWKKRVANR